MADQDPKHRHQQEERQPARIKDALRDRRLLKIQREKEELDRVLMGRKLGQQPPLLSSSGTSLSDDQHSNGLHATTTATTVVDRTTDGRLSQSSSAMSLEKPKGILKPPVAPTPMYSIQQQPVRTYDGHQQSEKTNKAPLAFLSKTSRTQSTASCSATPTPPAPDSFPSRASLFTTNTNNTGTTSTKRSISWNTAGFLNTASPYKKPRPSHPLHSGTSPGVHRRISWDNVFQYEPTIPPHVSMPTDPHPLVSGSAETTAATLTTPTATLSTTTTTITEEGSASTSLHVPSQGETNKIQHDKLAASRSNRNDPISKETNQTARPAAAQLSPASIKNATTNSSSSKGGVRLPSTEARVADFINQSSTNEANKQKGNGSPVNPATAQKRPTPPSVVDFAQELC